MSTRRRTWTAGLAISVLYVALAIATIALSSRHVRPLFEGIGPSAPYRWVNPPPAFAAGNSKPQPTTTDVPIETTGSKAAGVTSDDSQFILNLPPGAVPPHGADTSLRIAIIPLDPGALGALPTGLRPDGNAYHVQFAYQPSGTPVAIAIAGNVIVTLPEAGKTLLRAPDGKRWESLVSQSVGGPTVLGSTFDKDGDYLGAAIRHAATTKSGRSSSTLVVTAAIIGLALAIFFVPVAIRRIGSRRRRPRSNKGQRRR